MHSDTKPCVKMNQRLLFNMQNTIHNILDSSLVEKDSSINDEANIQNKRSMI
jgi:hypothetical protein